MPILHSPGVMMPGQFGPISRDFEPHEHALDLDHVADRNALGDADDQLDAGVGRFAGSRRPRTAAARRSTLAFGAGRLHRFGDGIEDRQAEMRRAALAGRDAADHLGAIVDACSAWNVPLLAGKALADDLRVLVDEDRHCAQAFLGRRDDLLGRIGQVVGRDDVEAAVARASSCRARRWCLRAARRAALQARLPSPRRSTPSAITSHFMMPPKMLTRMPLTLGSAVMILNAAVTLLLGGAAADIEEVRRARRREA